MDEWETCLRELIEEQKRLREYFNEVRKKKRFRRWIEKHKEPTTTLNDFMGAT